MRSYFAQQRVCEVTTPAVIAYPSCEPGLDNLIVGTRIDPDRWYLRTSPEAAMKRLLAAGSGDIYQLGPAFRPDPHGRHHLVEFTLLEWYRVGFDLWQLMGDVEGLLRTVGWVRPLLRLSYNDLFQTCFGVAPHELSTAALAQCVAAQPVGLTAADFDDRALLFDCLFACVLEPALARMGAVFLYDFPIELRAYARLSATAPSVAQRCELIVDGLELANGYYEITDAAEQAECFATENATRRRRGLPAVAPDPAWLAALAAGMPACAGVALGLERLLLVLGHGHHIDAVSSFAAELDPLVSAS